MLKNLISIKFFILLVVSPSFLFANNSDFNLLIVISLINVSYGEVAERLKALVLKTSNGATRSWVRIPPSPPLNFKLTKNF